MHQTLLLLPALCGILMGAAGGEGVAASAGGAAWDVPGGDRGWQGAPFEIRGRVLDHETDRPVEGVAVTLLDLSDERVAGAYTDAEGGFSIAGQGAGEYRLSFRHLGYAEYRSDPLAVAEHETVTVDVRLSRATYTLDPLTVIARATPHRHDATYGGLYQRIPREMAQVGRNRILVKGDWELDMGLSARDILERVFPRVWWRRGGMCLYWNGFLVSTPMVASRLQTHVDDLEAMEVYGDYLRAPMSMWGPPPTPLATTCSGVVALWALRPDLPGRGPR